MNILPILETQNLSRMWGNTAVFGEVHLRVYPGDFLAISGESGAGKSTLLRVLGTLDRAYKGELTIFEQSVESMDDRALSRFRNHRISFVFQSHQLLPHLTVEENILLPWAYRRTEERRGDLQKNLNVLLGTLGLADKSGALPHALSGGQQQRVAIARALITEPALLLCDELTGNLDRRTADHVMNALEEYQQASDCALIVVSHDPHVLQRAKQHLVLKDGVLTSVDSRNDALKSTNSVNEVPDQQEAPDQKGGPR